MSPSFHFRSSVLRSADNNTKSSDQTISAVTSASTSRSSLCQSGSGSSSGSNSSKHSSSGGGGRGRTGHTSTSTAEGREASSAAAAHHNFLKGLLLKYTASSPRSGSTSQDQGVRDLFTLDQQPSLPEHHARLLSSGLTGNASTSTGSTSGGHSNRKSIFRHLSHLSNTSNSSNSSSSNIQPAPGAPGAAAMTKRGQPAQSHGHTSTATHSRGGFAKFPSLHMHRGSSSRSTATSNSNAAAKYDVPKKDSSATTSTTTMSHMGTRYRPNGRSVPIKILPQAQVETQAPNQAQYQAHLQQATRVPNTSTTANNCQARTTANYGQANSTATATATATARRNSTDGSALPRRMPPCVPASALILPKAQPHQPQPTSNVHQGRVQLTRPQGHGAATSPFALLPPPAAAAIPIPPHHIRRTASEQQLTEEEMRAEYRDAIMYHRCYPAVLGAAEVRNRRRSDQDHPLVADDADGPTATATAATAAIVVQADPVEDEQEEARPKYRRASAPPIVGSRSSDPMDEVLESLLSSNRPRAPPPPSSSSSAAGMAKPQPQAQEEDWMFGHHDIIDEEEEDANNNNKDGAVINVAEALRKSCNPSPTVGTDDHSPTAATTDHPATSTTTTTTTTTNDPRATTDRAVHSPVTAAATNATATTTTTSGWPLGCPETRRSVEILRKASSAAYSTATTESTVSSSEEDPQETAHAVAGDVGGELNDVVGQFPPQQLRPSTRRSNHRRLRSESFENVFVIDDL